MNPTDFRGDLLGVDDWQSRDLRGQRVAVVSTTVEAARIVPGVVLTAKQVKVFQTAPAWLLPAHLPLPGGPLRRAAARLHLRLAVDDQWLRRQLSPLKDEPRVAVRRGYYDALQRPNCKLYTWPVYAIVEHGVRSAEGIEHRVDVIILGGDAQVTAPAAREERIA